MRFEVGVCAQNVTWGDPPAERERLDPLISELRDPILIIFDVLKSRLLEFSALIFFMGFVTAWSFDPERFARKHLISLCCLVGWMEFFETKLIFSK